MFLAAKNQNSHNNGRMERVMKKLFTFILMTSILVFAAAAPSFAFDPVEGINLTPKFNLEKTCKITHILKHSTCAR